MKGANTISDNLRLTGVGKRFDEFEAVRDISFTVSPGSITALVGPAGAGKSTVLRMVAGLIKPSEGTITVNVPTGTGVRTGTGGARVAAGADADNRSGVDLRPGVDVRPGAGVPQATGPRVIGSLLRERGLHPARTARDHLWALAPAAGVGRRRVDEVLAIVGLSVAADTPIARLLPSQQVRLAIGAALLADPPLLVFDDPFIELPPEERGWLHALLRDHTARGGSVLIGSASLAAVVSVADQLIVLSEGAIVWQGTPTRLRRGHPDRLVIAAQPSIGLATALAARGFTDAVMRPDGRLAVAEADEATVRSVANAAGVRIGSIVADPIHPDRVLASLSKPRRSATIAPSQPAYAPAMTQGMSR
ncbi:ATP-binding cassette domain-containing protein [Nocardia camponoti]|uniref:ABC transporter ATP-binding protein n=1 Tax=Nocardia camponoti TaxID=1616106 RepID=A0A917QEM4_9NOCA|nr:ATP-binding cassette domain-containing protein [Nocardia camponoti]GGK47014.1 ABC transporter ATP-binding protein [Nocardia camponoti]